MCLNSGWGFTHPAGWGSPDELQVVSIPIIEQETCVNIYQDIGLVYDGEICAGGPDQGACNVRSINSLIFTKKPFFQNRNFQSTSFLSGFFDPFITKVIKLISICAK